MPTAVTRRTRSARRASGGAESQAAAVWRAVCVGFDVDPDDERLAACAPADRGWNPGFDMFDAATTATAATAAAWLGEQHLAAQEPALRSREGRFYTPPLLSRCLTDQAWPFAQLPGLVVDPACGSGALLVAMVERAVAEWVPAEAVSWVVERIRGTDLDEGAVDICNLAIALSLLPAWSALAEDDRPTLPAFAAVRDGLADDRPAAVVLANPPFGRVTLTPSEREPWADVLYGHAHRPTLFLAAAVRRLVRGGAAAFVVPASMVGGAYYQKLRAYLMDEAPPAWLAFVADREGVFAGGVLQESLLGMFVRGTAREVPPSVERIATNGGVRRVVLSRAELPGRGREPWLLPREPTDGAVLEAAASMPHRLGDYGWKVSTGPLVWNRHRRQLHREAEPDRLPVIWAADIEGGKFRLAANREFRWCSVEAGQGWLVLDRPAILLQRTTAPEQPRRLVAAYLSAATLRRLGGRVVVENHLNVFTSEAGSQLAARTLLGYLASGIADRLYRCLTGSVAVSAFELAALPLPSPGEWPAG